MKTLISILGKANCKLRFEKYQNNTVAITISRKHEDWWTATINWQSNWEGTAPYGKSFAFPHVVISNFSENEGMSAALTAAGVLQPNACAMLSGSGGNVKVHLLTEEWQKVAIKQLNAI